MDTQNQELSNEREELKEVNLPQPGFYHEGDLWFDCPTAAGLMKISESGFYALIERYKDMMTEYIKSMRGFRARNSKHISKKRTHSAYEYERLSTLRLRSCSTQHHVE